MQYEAILCEAIPYEAILYIYIYTHGRHRRHESTSEVCTQHASITARPLHKTTAHGSGRGMAASTSSGRQLSSYMLAESKGRCALLCRNRGLRVHRPTVTTVTPRTYITIYFIQPPSSLSTPSPPPAAHDQQDAASHTCRPRRYPGVLARLRTGSPSGSYRSATPPALPGTVFLY